MVMSQKRVVSCVALLSAVSIVGGGLAGLSAQSQGIPGSLAFYSARDGNNEIYVMDGNGGGPRRITNHTASDVDPDISTNGRDTVFTSNRTGNNDIYVVDSDGGIPVNLTANTANDGWARWSPDGQHIAFHSNRDGNFELYIMNSDGSDPRRLTEYSGVDQYPDWSPNGREIAFRRDVDIYVIDVITRETRRLTNAPMLNQMPVWSPNGKHLAFMSNRAGYISVFVMNADGTGQTNLTPKDPGDADSDWVSRAPCWSRTGHQIYFMSSRPSTGLDTEIFVIDPDGSGTTRLTNSIGVDGSPRVR
jgi:Tol biopolymer transport system component